MVDLKTFLNQAQVGYGIAIIAFAVVWYVFVIKGREIPKTRVKRTK